MEPETAALIENIISGIFNKISENIINDILDNISNSEQEPSDNQVHMVTESEDLKEKHDQNVVVASSMEVEQAQENDHEMVTEEIQKSIFLKIYLFQIFSISGDTRMFVYLVFFFKKAKYNENKNKTEI